MTLQMAGSGVPWGSKMSAFKIAALAVAGAILTDVLAAPTGVGPGPWYLAAHWERGHCLNSAAAPAGISPEHLLAPGWRPDRQSDRCRLDGEDKSAPTPGWTMIGQPAAGVWRVGFRALRHDRSRASISAGWPQLPLLYPHGLYRRAAADRPRDGLPQSGRHLDGRRLTQNFSRLASLQRCGLLVPRGCSAIEALADSAVLD
jgi:hypothetical protein